MVGTAYHAPAPIQARKLAGRFTPTMHSIEKPPFAALLARHCVGFTKTLATLAASAAPFTPRPLRPASHPRSAYTATAKKAAPAAPNTEIPAASLARRGKFFAFTARPPSSDAPASYSARTARRSRACWLRSAYSGGTFLCSSAPWLPPASDTALRRPQPSRPHR